MYEFSVRQKSFLPHIQTQLEVTLPAGSALCLTGENGIGKSTLLKHFAESSDKKIVFGKQKPGELFFDRTLLTYQKILSENSDVIDREFFVEFWKRSGLAGKEERSLSHLSGGEAQLLKIISLLSSDAEIYFFDEPGQFLDREKKKLVSEMFARLLEKKKSLLIVEHDYSWLPSGSVVKELEVCNQELREKKSWTI